MRKIIILLSSLIFTMISFSYNMSLDSDINYNMCYAGTTSVEEKGILSVNTQACSFDRESYFNNNFSSPTYFYIGIKAKNISNLKKYIEENNAILMFKCGIKGYAYSNHGSTYVEVRREDIVVTDYESYLNKYKNQYDKYGCIPK